MREAKGHRFLFYAPLLDESSGSLDLVGEEFHHLSRVLRMSAGETAYATNGRGLLARCRVESVTRGAARFAVEEIEPAPSPGRSVTLAIALLRKDAFERAVEQCTELGIASLLPFSSERSHVRAYSQEFMTRLRRISLSAMKQSFRAILPEIEDPVAFDAAVARVRAPSRAVLGDADGEDPEFGPGGGEFLIVVGPEAGLSENERARLEEAGARPVRASPHRLRSETAAAALVALALSGQSRRHRSRAD